MAFLQKAIFACADDLHKDYSQACYQFGELAESKGSLPFLLSSMHDLLKKILPAENMFVSLVEEVQGKAYLRFPYYVDELEREEPLKLYAKEGLTGYVLDTARTLWLKESPSILEEVSFIGPRPIDWIGCPLKDKSGKVFGVFAVQSYVQGKSYTEADKRFLEFTARMISLFIQAQNNARELAIHRIAAIVDETANLKDIYPRIHEVLKDIIPAAKKSFTIVLADESKGVFSPEYWCDEKDDYTDYHWPLRNGLSGYIYNVSHRSFIYQDRVTDIPKEAITNIGTRSAYWLGAPLFIDTKVIGVVYIQTYSETDIITKEDEVMLNAIAPHIAEAINRARFFNSGMVHGQNPVFELRQLNKQK